MEVLEPGRTVTVDYVRDGVTLQALVTVARRDAEEPR